MTTWDRFLLDKNPWQSTIRIWIKLDTLDRVENLQEWWNIHVDSMYSRKDKNWPSKCAYHFLINEKLQSELTPWIWISRILTNTSTSVLKKMGNIFPSLRRSDYRYGESCYEKTRRNNPLIQYTQCHRWSYRSNNKSERTFLTLTKSTDDTCHPVSRRQWSKFHDIYDIHRDDDGVMNWDAFLQFSNTTRTLQERPIIRV